MLIKLALLYSLIGLALLIGETLRHRLGYGNEVSRKLVHILHALGLAALAFIVPMSVVVATEVLFFVLVLAGRYLYERFRRRKWMWFLGEMYGVGRVSYGEFFYPISIIIAAILADSVWSFAAAVLVLGIADATAALVGMAYGKKNSYIVLGQKKSVVGSLAFFAVSLVVLSACAYFSGGQLALSVPAIVGISLLLMVVENLGVYGSDNLLIPVVTVYMVNALRLLPN